jgi:NlpC/P60 family putative phage cell wall peptidase
VTPADPEQVIAAARGWLGTPYHDQASVRGVGCDCLGLVRGVWRELHGPEPLPIPPYSRDWGETGSREPLAEAARLVMIELPTSGAVPGALLLFRMRAGAVAKHCGIVTEADRFIHAYERSGVVEVPLDAAWRRRVAFAFLLPTPAHPRSDLRASTISRWSSTSGRPLTAAAPISVPPRRISGTAPPLAVNSASGNRKRRLKS